MRWRCQSCGHRFNERSGTLFNHLQYPTDIVLLVVLWRIRYKLSLRDLVEMFLTRGYEFSHETVRAWEERFAPLLVAKLKAKRRGQAGKSVSQFVTRARYYDSYLQPNLEPLLPNGVSAKAFTENIPKYIRLGTPQEPRLYHRNTDEFHKHMNSIITIQRARLV
jgi:hypothetical protein